MSYKSKLDTRRLDAIRTNLRPRAKEIIARTAYQIEGQAKLNIQLWPLIDTGALFNSIQTEQSDKSDLLWIVHDGVEYGVYWELGHNNIFTRRYEKKPFMVPAVEAFRMSFYTSWNALFV